MVWGNKAGYIFCILGFNEIKDEILRIEWNYILAKTLKRDIFL